MREPNPSLDSRSNQNPQSAKVDMWFESAIGRQESSWRRGDPVTIESIINSVPNQLSNDQQLSLICNEVFLRESAGQKPTLEEYQQRFAHLAKALEIQWRIDHMLYPMDQASTVVESGKASNQALVEIGGVIADRYQVLRQIGLGGMGTVYEAVDIRLRRNVALKVLNRSSRNADSITNRFRREAKLIASLENPHIVAIYDTGESDTGPYIAMQLCEAGTLADLLRQGTLSTRMAAELVQQTALGIDAAHQLGVVHRDLKPGNLLLVERVKADKLDCPFEIRVADFGLARQIEDDCGQTQTGDLLGTPAYLAPEQLLGSRSTPLALVDIYAMGAILYECLVGRPPIRGETAIETLRLLGTQEPVSIRTLQPNVPVDLATIAHKCLQRDPKDRYQTAKQVADDLQRFLQGQPIVARPTSNLARLLKWSKRNPAIAGLVGGVIGSLSLGLVTTSYMYYVAKQNALVAKTNEQTANQNEQTAIENAKVAKRNAELAAGSVNEYLTEIAENEELKQAGLELLRRKLLSKAQEYYLELIQQPTQNAKQQRELAEVYRRLALISNELGQTEVASQNYDAMIKLLKKLVDGQAAKNNENDELERSISLGLKERAAIVYQIGDSNVSDSLFQQSIDSLRRLSARTNSIADKAQLAWTLSEYGQQITAAERGDEQKAIFDEVAQLCKQVADTQENYTPTVADQLISASDKLALNWQSRSQLDDAIECFKQVCKLSEAQLNVRPGNTTLIRSLARGHKGLQLTYVKLQKLDDATLEFEAADRALQSLCNEHPLVIQFLDDRAATVFNHATALARAGKTSDAVKLLFKAIEIQKQVIRMDPKSFEANNAMVLFCANTATVLLQTADLKQAESVVEDGLVASEITKAMKPDDPGLIYFSAILENTKAAVLRAQGKLSESADSFDRAASIATNIWSSDKTKVPIAILAATAHKNAGIVKRQLKKVDPSKSSADSGYVIADELHRLAPSLVESSILKADLLLLLAELEMDQDNRPKAFDLATQAFELFQQLYSTTQSPQRFLGGLGDCCYLLGRCAVEELNWPVAVDWLDKSIDYRTSDLEVKQKAGATSEAKRLSIALGTSLLVKAKALIKQQQYQQAKEVMSRVDGSIEELKATIAELSEQFDAANQ